MITLKELYLISDSTIYVKTGKNSKIKANAVLIVGNDDLANKRVVDIEVGKYEMLVEVK